MSGGPVLYLLLYPPTLRFTENGSGVRYFLVFSRRAYAKSGGGFLFRSDWIHSMKTYEPVLTRFEHGLLRQMDAMDDEGFGPTSWGAAIGEATTFLHSRGFLARVVLPDKIEYQLTDKGKKAANTSWEDVKASGPSY